MTLFERLESGDFDHSDYGRLGEFQEKLAPTDAAVRILKCCGFARGEPWKQFKPSGWFNVGGNDSMRKWHASVYLKPCGVEVVVLGATKALTHRLAKKGVETLAELVRLCVKSSDSPPIAVGCSRGWYKYPSSPYKAQNFDHWETALMENPGSMTESERSNFTNKLWKLLDEDDPRYRTELNIRYLIPREKITHKDLDLSAQVRLVEDALLKIEGPLAFLVNMEKVRPKRKKQSQWRWEDGVVDDGKEHIELRHGDAAETQYEDWFPIARIGRSKHHVFPVQWLVKPDSPENQAMIADGRRDLDYFLVELYNPDPWAYAVYHCTTASNMYASVHWSYFPNGRGSERVSSTVIELSPKEWEELRGKPEKDEDGAKGSEVVY